MFIINTFAALQLNRTIQYNDKSNSNTTQQSVTEITNACKILYIFIKLTGDNSRMAYRTAND